MSLLRNTASQVLTFALVNATTGAALTGATVTTRVALDGTQSAGAGTATELGAGQYKYVPTQGETNGASVGFSFTATNAVPVNLHCFTTSNDPATVIPTAAQNAAALLDAADAIDTGLTPRHALELAAASVLQKLSGAGTNTETVRNYSDSKNLATVTVDNAGNKTAITYDFSI